MIDIKQVLTGEPICLRYVKRFSICPRVHEESVAEHSYFVAFIAMMIAVDLREIGEDVNVELLLCRALLHDLDEIFSGDFIRMFKHDNRTLCNAIDTTAEKLLWNFARNYSAGINLFRYWKDAKAKDREGYILAYADYLSVLSYVWQEINAGNKIMFKQIDELEKFSNSFKSPEYKFLASYREAAEQLLKELRSLQCRND